MQKKPSAGHDCLTCRAFQSGASRESWWVCHPTQTCIIYRPWSEDHTSLLPGWGLGDVAQSWILPRWVDRMVLVTVTPTSIAQDLYFAVHIWHCWIQHSSKPYLDAPRYDITRTLYLNWYWGQIEHMRGFFYWLMSTRSFPAQWIHWENLSLCFVRSSNIELTFPWLSRVLIDTSWDHIMVMERQKVPFY